MRLGTCIALELAVVAGAVTGGYLAITRTGELAGDYLSAREASAATPSAARAPTLEALPAAELRVAAPPIPQTVFGVGDDVLLAPLGASPVAQVKINHGGTSLSLRVEFASGARAAFKPQQIHPQSDPRKEIAAFRIDRLLGIGHVPPARPIALAVDDLVAASEPIYRTYTASRIDSEAIAKDGIVRGELSWWIPEIRDLRIGAYRVDEDEGIDLWTSYLQAGATIPREVKPLVEQLAACVLFDILIDNSDRWTGNNTKGSVDGKTLYFMDNTLSFSVFTVGHETNLGPLRKMSVFPRQLVTRLRALTREQLVAAIGDGDNAGMGPLLDEDQIHAILQRRDHLIHYIDAMIAEFGEDAVLALP
ncbi:MAG: hypothetical protein ACM31C_26825 [Acidobacteriota bacterium]